MDSRNGTEANFNINDKLVDQEPNTDVILNDDEDDFIQELYMSAISANYKAVGFENEQHSDADLSRSSFLDAKNEPVSDEHLQINSTESEDTKPPAAMVEEVSLKIEKVKQEKRELQDIVQKQEKDLVDYEERIREAMSDAYKIRTERDSLKENLEITEKARAELEIKYNGKEAELFQFKELVHKNVVDTNDITDLRNKLNSLTKAHEKIKKELLNATNLLDIRNKALKKFKCGNKKLVNSTLQFGAMLKEKGFLTGKQLKYLKAVEEQHLKEDPGYENLEQITDNNEVKQENNSEDYKEPILNNVPFVNGEDTVKQEIQDSDYEHLDSQYNGGAIGSNCNRDDLDHLRSNDVPYSNYNGASFNRSLNVCNPSEVATSALTTSHNLHPEKKTSNFCDSVQQPFDDNLPFSANVSNNNVFIKKENGTSYDVQKPQSNPSPFRKPYAASPNFLHIGSKADSVCSEDFMDLSGEDVAEMIQQVSIKSELLSPLPRSPSPLYITPIRCAMEDESQNSRQKISTPSQIFIFNQNGTTKCNEKRATLHHQTSKGFEPHIDEPSNSANVSLNNSSTFDSGISSEPTLPPHLSYVSSERVNDTILIRKINDVNVEILFDDKKGTSVCAVTRSNSKRPSLSESNASEPVTSQTINSTQDRIRERINLLSSFLETHPQQTPSKIDQNSYMFTPIECAKSSVSNGFPHSTPINTQQLGDISSNVRNPCTFEKNDGTFQTPKTPHKTEINRNVQTPVRKQNILLKSKPDTYSNQSFVSSSCEISPRSRSKVKCSFKSNEDVQSSSTEPKTSEFPSPAQSNGRDSSCEINQFRKFKIKDEKTSPHTVPKTKHSVLENNVNTKCTFSNSITSSDECATLSKVPEPMDEPDATQAEKPSENISLISPPDTKYTVSNSKSITSLDKCVKLSNVPEPMDVPDATQADKQSKNISLVSPPGTKYTFSNSKSNKSSDKCVKLSTVAEPMDVPDAAQDEKPSENISLISPPDTKYTFSNSNSITSSDKCVKLSTVAEPLDVPDATQDNKQSGNISLISPPGMSENVVRKELTPLKLSNKSLETPNMKKIASKKDISAYDCNSVTGVSAMKVQTPVLESNYKSKDFVSSTPDMSLAAKDIGSIINKSIDTLDSTTKNCDGKDKKNKMKLQRKLQTCEANNTPNSVSSMEIEIQHSTNTTISKIANGTEEQPSIKKQKLELKSSPSLSNNNGLTTQSLATNCEVNNLSNSVDKHLPETPLLNASDVKLQSNVRQSLRLIETPTRFAGRFQKKSKINPNFRIGLPSNTVTELKCNNASNPQIIKNSSLKQTHCLRSSEKGKNIVNGNINKINKNARRTAIKKSRKRKPRSKRQKKFLQQNITGAHSENKLSGEIKSSVAVQNLSKTGFLNKVNSESNEIVSKQLVQNGVLKTSACIANENIFNSIQTEEQFNSSQKQVKETPDCKEKTESIPHPGSSDCTIPKSFQNKDEYSQSNSFLVRADVHWDVTKAHKESKCSTATQHDAKQSASENSLVVLPTDKSSDPNYKVEPVLCGLFLSNGSNKLAALDPYINFWNGISDSSFKDGPRLLSPIKSPVKQQKSVLNVSVNLTNEDCHTALKNQVCSVSPRKSHSPVKIALKNHIGSPANSETLQKSDIPVKTALQNHTGSLLNAISPQKSCSPVTTELQNQIGTLLNPVTPQKCHSLVKTANSASDCSTKQNGFNGNETLLGGTSSSSVHNSHEVINGPTIPTNVQISPQNQILLNARRISSQSSTLSDDEHALIIAEDPEEETASQKEDVIETKESTDETIDDRPVNKRKSRKKKKSQNSAGKSQKKPKILKEETSDCVVLSIPKAFEELEKCKFDECHFKIRVHTLVNALINPANAPDTVSLIFQVIQQLTSSRRNPLMSFSHSNDTSVLLPRLEKCLIISLIQVESKKKSHLKALLSSTINSLSLLVLSKDSVPIYGLCAFCRVITEICKLTDDSKKPIALCCDLLKIQHKFAPYLIASIAGVWSDIFAVTDGTSERKALLQSAIVYGVNTKPKTLTDTQWKYCCSIFARFLRAPAISDVTGTARRLCKIIQSTLEEEQDEDEYMLTDPLVIFSICEGWKWTQKNLLDNFILPSLVKYSVKEKKKRAFTLFCELYSEISLQSPDCLKPIDVLSQFFHLTEAPEYVKHAAACSSIKLFLLKKQIIPAFLSQWTEENENNLKTSSFELLLRRRLMSDTPELTEEDVVCV